jgi:hypothetical protein
VRAKVSKGQRFGCLVTRDYFQRLGWECLCDCGASTFVRSTELMRSVVVSCGCYGVRARLLANRRKTYKQGPGEAGLKLLFKNYQSAAKRRGYPFELSLEQFRFVTQQACRYCGIEPRQTSTVRNKGSSSEEVAHRTYRYNGIDRIDNSVGYLVSNCIPCCKTCNRAKHTMTQEEFMAWIERLRAPRSGAA